MLEVGRELRMCQIRSFDFIFYFFILSLSFFFLLGFMLFLILEFGMEFGKGWDVEGRSIKI